jgi:histidinol-phosphate aminotransferase
MFDPEKLVRESVRNLIPYSSARDEFQGKEGIFLDANENPFGKLNRYPDPYQRELKEGISVVKEIPSENIFLGNGSDEIIDLCFRIFCSPGIDKALTFTPTYGMYQVSASVNDVGMIRIPLDDEFRIDYDLMKPWLQDRKLKLIFICSPNNPTGNCMDRKTIERIIENFSGIVIIDEAYIDFTDEPSFKGSLSKYQNLIVLQTFSKAWGMASVRVGIALCSQHIIHYFNKMKPPYNISTINQRTVINRLRQGEAFRNEISKIREERQRLSSELIRFPFTEKVFPSDANFLLVRVKDALFIYNFLVKNNIIVRNRSSVVENCLRITIGTKTENNRLLKALKKIEL